MLSRVLLFISLIGAVSAAQAASVKWEYDGHLGPDVWRNLSPDFRQCGDGMQQSPVDLAGAVETRIADIELHWAPADWYVINTGHTIEIAADDAGYAYIDGQPYDLIHFEFHTPSEHAFDGLHYPMEVQFVHRNEAGEVAIIAVMMKGGGRNDAFEAIMANAPIHANHRTLLGLIDAAALVSDLTDIMRYRGSLTMPPCTENVLWTVLTDPVTVSDAAILAFESLFDMNARPLQPLNRRYILTD